MPGKPMLSFRDVSKSYHARGRVVNALKHISFDVLEGDFLTVVGPSGCGKSTLLNLITCLEAPTQGTISFLGDGVKPGDRRIGYVTQQDNLLPWRTLVSNIAFPLEIAGVAVREREDRAKIWIEKLGLRGFENSYPHELSGGMRQRANIARTLIYSPRLVMMDEPFGPLDAQTRLQLQTELLRIWEETNTSVLFITHDLAEAIALSRRVAVMSARPGTITSLEEIVINEPRDIAHIHDDPQFREVYDRMWTQLEAIVRQSAP